METFFRDSRLALRNFLKRPGVTLLAAFCLATGIGATAAVFGLVDAVLLRPLGYPDADELRFLWSRFQQRDVEREPLLPSEFVDLVERFVEPSNDNDVFAGVTGAVGWFYNLTGEGLPERLVAQRVATNYFAVVGVGPERGRGFGDDDLEGGVVILSHAFWRTRFGGDPGALGEVISLDGEPHEVIGILPEDFDPVFVANSQIWVPLDPRRDLPEGQRRVRTLLRLEAGTSEERARAAIDSIAETLADQDPDTYPAESGWGLYAVPLREDLVGDVRPLLVILAGAVALVMLIACANVANLLLAQATAREKEIALRAALGADGRRIVRQLLTESVLLSLLGAVGGLFFAFWGIRGLQSLDLGEIPRLGEVAVDFRVLFFTLFVAVATGLLFGLAPALRAARTDLQSTLKEGGKTSAGAGRSPLRNLLVVGQVALAVAVLSAAGLMTRTMDRLESVDTGFSSDGVATLQLFLSMARYPRPEDRNAYYERLLDELATVPEVAKASVISDLPLSGSDFRRDITIEGYDPPAGAENPVVGWRFVSPGYFDVLGIELIEGRDFTRGDDLESANVVIVDQAMAERYWPDRSPLGQRLRINTPRPPFNEWRRIVGVARHVRHQALSEGADEQMYIPYPQFPYPVVSLAIEGRGENPLSVVRPVREAARRIDPEQPLAAPRTLESIVAESLSRPRFNRLLFGLFGVVALVLVSVGVYGVMAYGTAQQSREIGLRMALGSGRRRVLALVLRQGMQLAALGLALGLALAVGLGFVYRRTLAEMIYGVEVFDAATLLGVSALVLFLALLANVVPAFRATRVDPLVVLREE